MVFSFGLDSWVVVWVEKVGGGGEECGTPKKNHFFHYWFGWMVWILDREEGNGDGLSLEGGLLVFA